MKNIPSKGHTRSEVIRDTIVLQLKLIIDGLRDLILMPVVFFAAIIGLILHREQPGRYVYRTLSYGKITEKWIGLFEEAQKDTMKPIDLKDNCLDEFITKTQTAIESKYIDADKKQKLLNKLNNTLDEINIKLNPETKLVKDEKEY